MLLHILCVPSGYDLVDNLRLLNLEWVLITFEKSLWRGSLRARHFKCAPHQLFWDFHPTHHYYMIIDHWSMQLRLFVLKVKSLRSQVSSLKKTAEKWADLFSWKIVLPSLWSFAKLIWSDTNGCQIQLDGMLPCACALCVAPTAGKPLRA